MLKKLLKPKWEHRDPSVRIQAIGELEGSERESILIPIARHDPDSEVRGEAVRRLSSLPPLLEIEEKESDSKVRQWALQRAESLLSGTASSASLEKRLGLLSGVRSSGLIARLAKTAPEEALRRAALDRVDDQKVLAEVALGDDSPELRLRALARIDREALLERVSRETRKHDKRVHGQAREMLDKLKLERGEEEAVRRRMDALCMAAEDLAWRPESSEIDLTLDQIRTEWESFDQHPQDLLERFTRACQSGLNNPKPAAESVAKEQPQPETTAQEPAPEPTPAKTETSPPDPFLTLCQRAEKLSRSDRIGLQDLKGLRRTWNEKERAVKASPETEKRFEEAMSRLADQCRSLADSLNDRLKESRGLLDEARNHLTSGRILEARGAWTRSNEIVKSLRTLRSKAKEELKRQLSTVHDEIRDLQEWQHWSNNQIRLKLCDDIEGLPELELDAPELERRIRAAREQWNQLEESEKLRADEKHHASGPRLWRRFHAAAHRAYQPCREYRKKQIEESKDRFRDMEALCGKLETASTESALDWKPLSELIRSGARALSDLNSINPKKRGEMARRLRAALAGLEKAKSEILSGNESKKKDLIEKVRALEKQDDPRAAFSELRRLQGLWRETGTTVRGKEQELWKAFREACSTVVRGGQGNSRDEGDDEKTKERLALCKLVETLPHNADEIGEAEERFRKAKSAWQEGDHSRSRQDRRFQSSSRKFHERLQDLRRLRERKERDRLVENREKALVERARLCMELEDSTLGPDQAAAGIKEAQDRWKELPPLEKCYEESLEGRFKEARAAALEGENEDRTKRRDRNGKEVDLLCVRMELLAGIDSPPDSIAVRRDYQFSQLSAALERRETAPDPLVQADDVLTRFCTIGAVTIGSGAPLLARFEKALSAFRDGKGAKEQPGAEAAPRHRAREASPKWESGPA